jgi:hypothetical protein
MLNPRNAWSDRNAYDKTAQKLVQLLTENFKKYVGRIDKAVAQALVANSQPAQKQVPQAAKAIPVNAPAPIAAEISSENVPLENASEASTQALSGKKAAPAKKAKPPKKLRAKEIIPPEEEAEVGDTGLDISIDEQYPSNDDSNIVIPPGLFATEPQGEFRPDDESPMIASAFDDDEEDDASEQSGEQDGQSDDDPNRPQGQFKGNRRRRGGRGRRRPH